MYDQLKAASDLGVPVVGVGLLYQQGYFRQAIDKDGAQQALYPYNDPGKLPITSLRQANGELLRVEIALPCCSVWLRTWQVQVGRVKLYLLDSNDAAKRVRQLAGVLGGYVYSAAVSAARPPADYTPRVVPHCDGVAIPLENARILWAR